MVQRRRKVRESYALSCSSLFFFIALLYSSSAELTDKGVNYEVLALIGIKSSLIDPHGVLMNWDDTAVDPCSWNMISCSADGFVLSLGAPSQDLSGTLSSSISNLTYLQTVLLQNNYITGHIPPEIGKLMKLKTLDLSTNNFTGQIPSTLSASTNLQYLDLSYNNLSGPVPRSHAKTFNVMGNPKICPTGTEKDYEASDGGTKNRKIAIAFGVGLACVCLLITAFGFLLWWRRRHNQQIFFDVNDQNKEEVCLGNLRRFSFKELQSATSNFSSKNLVGKGGFGNVYKGRLHDGTIVAVKRLKDVNNGGGEIQFQTEVEMISLAVHRNLLRLYGLCTTSMERLLVYPYMSNGSVASRLKAKPVLDWSTRKRIALGAARGLLYLHEQCDPKIIHRDVKAANILLDDYYEAVVGDFGLAKLLDHKESHVTTAVRGTVGHIAPEYLSTGQSSEKTDVFGFGILLLELITGLRALEFGKAANQRGAILDWVKKLQQEKNLEQIVDKDLERSYDRIEVEEIVKVALLCTQYLPIHRPKMSEVVRMLEGDGLVEKWEASSQRTETNRSYSKPNEFSSSERYSDLTDDSSVLVQAMELSGPR
ncbi:hypothetical protein DY000_02025210 [Brassica cretica]|uniref:Protein kinase domain-containing protein n=1 Tax=Brassica cretica TaxID=69181 RepID=A0ABQ7E4P3_BRACR|nr:hypothetical protein DY000_02025210 [Brassica cretica]